MGSPVLFFHHPASFADAAGSSLHQRGSPSDDRHLDDAPGRQAGSHADEQLPGSPDFNEQRTGTPPR